MTYQTRDTLMYVTPPDDHPRHDIPELLRWAIAQLEKAKGDSPILLTGFHLVRPYTETAQPAIYTSFVLPDAETQAIRQEAASLAAEATVSDELPTLEYAAPLEQTAGLNRFILRLPAGPDQDDGLALLKMTAETIDNLGEYEVLDLIYHDFLDDDALGRPYMVVYFQLDSHKKNI